MASRIKGILFDKDGTLIDFNRTWLPLYQNAAALLGDRCDDPLLANELLIAGGYQPESNTWLADSLLAAGSNAQIMAAWQQQSGLVFDEQLIGELQAVFSTGLIEYATVVEDLRAFMRTLRTSGLKIGVATMDDEAHARQTLESLNISDQVDFICGADSGHGVKPEPGMVQAFCQHVSLNADTVVMVGDSPRDLTMAASAGCASAVGVLTGASTAIDLAPFAHHVISSIADLPALLTEHYADHVN